MDGLDPSTLEALAGWLLLTGLFVLREVASRALKQAGEKLWEAIKRRRDGEPDPSCRADSDAD